MGWRLLSCALALFAVAVLPGPAAAEEIGNATRGEALFNRECTACHQIGTGALNRIGPALNGIYGRRAGDVEGFNCSTRTSLKGP